LSSLIPALLPTQCPALESELSPSSTPALATRSTSPPDHAELPEPGEPGPRTPRAEPSACSQPLQLDPELDRGLAPPSELLACTTTRSKLLHAQQLPARTSEPGHRGLPALSPAEWEPRPEPDTATAVPSVRDSALEMRRTFLEMKLSSAIWVIAASGTGPAGLDAAEETTATSDSDSEETTADRTSSRSRSHVKTTLPTLAPLTLLAR